MTITDKQLAGHQRRTLRKMRQRFLEMAAAWDGLDEFNVTQFTELANQVEKAATELIESTEVRPCAA